MTIDKWSSLSVCEQMANIGSEVERAISWKNKGNNKYFQNCFFRVLELVDLSMKDRSKRHTFLREVARARETLVDYFYGDNQYASSDKLWQKYFFAYNYKARL